MDWKLWGGPVGQRVTEGDGWGAGKEYGNGDGGRGIGSSVWFPCLAKPRA